MAEIYCWCVHWKNYDETFWHNRMTYPKLADRTFTKEDALKILNDVVSKPTTEEVRFRTIIEGSKEHRAIEYHATLIEAGVDVINYTVSYK